MFRGYQERANRDGYEHVPGLDQEETHPPAVKYMTSILYNICRSN